MSGKEKFTPGPWRHLMQYDQNGKFSRSYVCYGVPNSVNPDDSTFPPDQCICGCGKSHLAHNAANADLIATAPEMYDALEQIADLLQRLIDFKLLPNGTYVKQINHLLAKARGEGGQCLGSRG